MDVALAGIEEANKAKLEGVFLPTPPLPPAVIQTARQRLA